MGKLFVVFTILGIFAAVSVKGFDKETAKAILREKAEMCKEKVGASEC